MAFLIAAIKFMAKPTSGREGFSGSQGKKDYSPSLWKSRAVGKEAAGHIMLTVSEQRRTGSGAELENVKACPRDPFPPEKLRLLKAPQPSQTVPSAAVPRSQIDEPVQDFSHANYNS